MSKYFWLVLVLVLVLLATTRGALVQPFVTSEALRTFTWFVFFPLLLALFVYLSFVRKPRRFGGKTGFQAVVLAQSRSRIGVIGRTFGLAASLLFMAWTFSAGVLVNSVWLHKAIVTAGVSMLVKVESIQARTGRTFGGYVYVKAVDPQTHHEVTFFWPNEGAMYVPYGVARHGSPEQLCIVGDGSVLGVLIVRITPHACTSVSVNGRAGAA